MQICGQIILIAIKRDSCFFQSVLKSKGNIDFCKLAQKLIAYCKILNYLEEGNGKSTFLKVKKKNVYPFYL